MMNRLEYGMVWLAALVFVCVVALWASSGEAAIYLGRAWQSDAKTDPAAIDWLVDPDPGFTMDFNQIAKNDGSVEGLFGTYFTVTEADGTAFDFGDSLTAKWTLTGVPEILEPIYYIIKSNGYRDMWQFDTLSGDTKEDLGGGLFTYTSVELPTDPPGSPYTQGISHVSVFCDGVVPEPSSLVICWSLIGILVFTVGRYRSRMRS